MLRSKAWKLIYRRLLFYHKEEIVQTISIQVKDLQKSYKKLNVLKGVDFTVEQGSIFALLGSNGAGKTTLVKILTTLLKQDGGTAIVNGFDVVSKPDNVRQSLSLTGQFAAVDEILTGQENLIMIARLRHLKHPRQVEISSTAANCPVRLSDCRTLS